MLVMVIGPTYGAERALHECGPCPQPFQHVEQNMIIGNIDRIARNLGWNMPVADVPGESQQVEDVAGTDLYQLLGCCANLHEPSAVETDRISVFQDIGPFEIEQECGAAIGMKHDPATMAVSVIEGDDIDDAILVDGFAADDGCSSDHFRTRSSVVP